MVFLRTGPVEEYSEEVKQAVLLLSQSALAEAARVREVELDAGITNEFLSLVNEAIQKPELPPLPMVLRANDFAREGVASMQFARSESISWSWSGLCPAWPFC